MNKATSFQQQLLMPLVTVVVVLFLGIFFFSWYHIQFEERERIENTAQQFFSTFQEIIVDDLKHNRLSKVQISVDQLIQSEDKGEYFSDITIVRPDGHVLVSAPQVIRSAPLDELSQQALESKGLQKKRNGYFLEIASPILFDKTESTSGIFAIVRGTYSLKDFHRKQLIYQVVLALILGILFFGMINWAVRFSKSISLPLVELTQKLKNYLKGQDQPIEVDPSIKEIEELGDVYNGLIAQRKSLTKQVMNKTRLHALGMLSKTYGHVMSNALNNILSAVSVMAISDDKHERQTIKKEVEDDIKRINRFSVSLSKSTKLQNLEMKQLDMNQVIEKIVRSLTPNTKQSRINITKDFTKDSSVYADEDLIHTALENIVINSLEALRADGNIHIATRNGSKNLILEISDTGPGISKKDLNVIFDPFFTTKKRGSGIGLSQVKEIMDLHRADISATSTLGKGTVFTMTFLKGETHERTM